MSRPQRYVIVPDSSKFSMKLPTTTTFVKSPTVEIELEKKLVNSVLGITFGTLILSKVSLGINYSDSLEKKKVSFFTVAISMSLY